MRDKINIAVVDDEEEFHSIVRMNFKTEVRAGDIEIFYFNNGKECLDFLSDETYHIEIIILLSDINMPEMDGFTLCGIIQENFPQIEVVIASAYDNTNFKEKAKNLGAEDYFVKPVDFTKLKKFIAEKIEDISKK